MFHSNRLIIYVRDMKDNFFIKRKTSRQLTWKAWLGMFVLIVLIFWLNRFFILTNIWSAIVVDTPELKHYDAIVIESWQKPQSRLISVADSLLSKGVSSKVYITFFKWSPTLMYSGGEVPVYSNEIINLYILGVSKDTSRYKKIGITPTDPVTINLADQVKNFMQKENVQSFLLLSESYHSQRTKLAFEKIFEHSKIYFDVMPVEIGITESNWWWTDAGLSTVFSEFIKLIYYKISVL